MFYCQTSVYYYNYISKSEKPESSITTYYIFLKMPGCQRNETRFLLNDSNALPHTHAHTHIHGLPQGVASEEVMREGWGGGGGGGGGGGS